MFLIFIVFVNYETGLVLHAEHYFRNQAKCRKKVFFSKSGSFIRPKVKQKWIQIKSYLDSTISIMCELDHGPT